MNEVDIFLENINESIEMLEYMQSVNNLPDESGLAVAYTIRGMLYFQTNKFDESIRNYNKGIEITERLLAEGKSPNVNELAKAYAGRGMAYHVVGEYEKALPDITKGIDIWERLQKLGQLIEESMLFNMYIMRGGTLNYMVDYMDDAISDYRKSIIIAERLKNAGKPFDENGLATAYMGVAESNDQKENFTEANNYYDKCIGIWERLINEGQPLPDESNLATAYMNRGCNYYVMKENTKALSDCNKCVNIRERLKNQGIQQDVYYVSLSYRNRALSYETANNITAAIKDYVLAVRVLKDEFSERPELQELYYERLAELIDLIVEEKNDVLYNRILDFFLHSMRSVPKTKEAEEAQNNIFEKLS
jgi:tetratricopeptide (TPR) repeat protein